jgi:conjugative transfer signal peptidase TraF
MKKTRPFAVCFTLCFACVTLLSFYLHHAGYRINLSPSVPTGFWKITEKEISEETREREYVIVLPSSHPGYKLAIERKYLADSMPMLKRVVATKGDVVSYDENEEVVTVNGQYILMTTILSKDTEGRPLPRAVFPILLKAKEFWLSSENIRGYDSRYFGPVSADLLRGAVPIWKF